MAAGAVLRKPSDDAERRTPVKPVTRAPQSTPRASNPARGGILPVGPTSSGIVNIKSSLFEPSQTVAEEIAAAGRKGLDVRVIAGGLTQEGIIKVRLNSGKKFVSIRNGSMPLLNPWMQKLGASYLNFEIANSAIKDGYASFKANGGSKNEWRNTLQKNANLLGGLGLKIESLPKPVNMYDGAKLVIGVTGAKVLVGGFVDAEFDLLLENMMTPTITGSAAITVGGTGGGEVKFGTTGDQLHGSASLNVTLKSFSGSANVVYKPDGTVDISGKASYNANKLSGEIQFVATDLNTANKFAKDAIAAAGGPANVQEAGPPAPVPAAKEGQKKRALAATGRLNFNLTKWFAGSVNVVVDGKGAVTVIGKIAPPGEIILLRQQPDIVQPLVKFKAKAYYGIPVVGNLNLFANISLNAIAKLGPAKFHRIEILGTYSTDPEIQKSIQISGSITISAYAGLRLHAEGGAGIEILGHDLKFGIGVNADIGVMAYADATPTIGYRDPGEFFISGTLELVAQPILGLSGEFFIDLDAPWISPLDDDRWTWPLFSKEWPLGDPIGISASMKQYVLGSGAVPEIKWDTTPDFKPQNFMTSMVDDKLPNTSGGKGVGKGQLKDDGSVPKPVVPPKKPAPKAAAAKPGKKGTKLAKSNSSAADAKIANDAKKGSAPLNKAKKPLELLKAKAPLTRSALDNELAKIKAQASGIAFAVASASSNWSVTPKAGAVTGRSMLIAAKPDILADGELGETVTFSAEDGGHKLWIDVKGGRPQLMLASTVKPLIDHLSAFKQDAKTLDPKPKAAVLEAIGIALPIAQDIAKWTKQAAGKEFGEKKREEADAQIEMEEAKLRIPLKLILDILGVKVPDKIKKIPAKFVPGAKAEPYPVEYKRQLKRQETEINKMTVYIWMQRRSQFKSAKKENLEKVDKRARSQATVRMIETLAERFTYPWHPAKPDALVLRVQKMTGVQTIVDNMFASSSAKDQKNGFKWNNAYLLAEAGMKGQNVLHEPDKVAGGRFDKIADVGLGEVNQDIGGKWPPLVVEIETAVRKQLTDKNISETLWRKPKMDVALLI